MNRTLLPSTKLYFFIQFVRLPFILANGLVTLNSDRCVPAPNANSFIELIRRMKERDRTITCARRDYYYYASTSSFTISEAIPLSLFQIENVQSIQISIQTDKFGILSFGDLFECDMVEKSVLKLRILLPSN